MGKYTLEQRLELLEIWYLEGKNNNKTATIYNKRHRSRTPLCESTVRRMMAKFIRTGNLNDANEEKTERPTTKNYRREGQ